MLLTVVMQKREILQTHFTTC